MKFRVVKKYIYYNLAQRASKILLLVSRKNKIHVWFFPCPNRVFDRDCDGFITADELRYIVTCFGEKLSDQEADELIAMFDTNKDGQLEYEEFVQWAKNSMAEYLNSLT